MVTQRGARLVVFVLAGILGFAPQRTVAEGLGVPAPGHAACNGPAALVRKMKEGPTTDNAVALGSWYASHNQLNCAVETFHAGLKTDPQSAQLHYLIGLADVDANHASDGLPDLQRAIALDPTVIKPHLLLALVYDQAGNHLAAEEEFHKALAIDPRSEPALDGLSQDLLSRKAYIDTVLLLRSAAKTEKLSIDLAKALGNLNMLDEARAVLTEALSENPKSLQLSSALIVVLVKQVRYQDAINLAQHMVDVNPGNQDSQLQLFRILVLTNHITAARPIGSKLLAERPRDPEVQYLDGIVLRSVGDDVGARQLLEQSVVRDPSSPNAHYELGMVLVRLKDWAPARRELEQAIAMGVKIPQVHYQLALAMRGLGDAKDAQQEIQAYQSQKASDESHLEASMKASQGDDELKADKVDHAIDDYKEAVAAEPDNANYKYKLAMALHRSGDTDGERRQLEQATKLDPSLAGAQNELGFLLSRAGDSNGAIDHFRMAVQSAPGYVEAWINLAAEFAMTGRFADARNAASAALRLDPQNERAHKLSERLSQDSGAQQDRP